MGERKRQINGKQAAVEWTEEEFPLLQQIDKQLKPFDEFWKTFAELARCEEYWYQTPVCELEPDEIKTQFKRLNGAVNRLENEF